MSANSDILHEIPDEDLPKLKNLFLKDWPFALHAYFWLDNYIEWKKRKITNIVFLCPGGYWNDGTFVAVEDNGGSFDVFVFTLEKSCKRLQEGLQETRKIKWNDQNVQLFILAVHESHQPLIMEEINKRQLTILHQDIGNMWWIPKEEAVKYDYEIPEEVYLGPLKPDDVEIIDSVWPHRGPFSRKYLLRLINCNGGFGLYLKTNDTLCAWIMRNNYGGMAILQTAEEHKKKGYGTVLAKHFSKYWAAKGLDVFCFIMKHNKVSIHLFQKLGYRREHEITWTQARKI